MKKLLYNCCIFFVFLAITLSSKAQRNVVWVHGLGGTSASWEHYKALFDQERNINSLKTSYNTSNGIDLAANEVVVSMNNFLGNDNKNAQNLGIGHSMGGVMIRDVDKMYSNNGKYFGGIITVATPNNGAPIANSLINGDVQSAAQDAANKLTDGPVSQILPLPWGILSNLTTDVLSNKFITNDLVQSLWGSPTTNAELMVGSDKMNSINSYYSTIPKIAVLAEETSPVHWRLFSTQMYGEDQTFVQTVNSARNVYNGFYVYNTSLAIVSCIFGFFSPAVWAVTAASTYRATQWVKGRNWIDDSENVWSSLIKTSRIEQQPYVIEDWVPCDPQYPLQSTSLLKNAPEDCYEWVWRTVYRDVSVNYPSDGFLPIYSQELQGVTASSGNRYYIVGANHVEVRDMSNSTLNGAQNDGTKLKFNQIFDRYPGDFFRTERRTQ